MLHKLVLALALVVAWSVSPAPASAGKKKPATLKLKKAAPLAAGTVVDVTSDMKLDMTIKTSQGDFPMSMTKQAPYSLEIVATDDLGVTKARVTYGKVSETQPMGKATAGPTSEKTYVLDYGASGLKVTREDGAEVSADELEAVQKEHAELRSGAKLRKLMIGRTFKQGKTVKLKAADFEAAFGDVDDMDVTAFLLRLDGVDGDVATFHYEVTMGKTEDKNTMTIAAAGDLTLDTARIIPLTMTFDGPVTGKMEQGGQSMTVDGQMHMTGTRTYRTVARK